MGLFMVRMPRHASVQNPARQGFGHALPRASGMPPRTKSCYALDLTMPCLVPLPEAF